MRRATAQRRHSSPQATTSGRGGMRPARGRPRKPGGSGHREVAGRRDAIGRRAPRRRGEEETGWRPWSGQCRRGGGGCAPVAPSATGGGGGEGPAVELSGSATPSRASGAGGGALPPVVLPTPVVDVGIAGGETEEGGRGRVVGLEGGRRATRWPFYTFSNIL